MDVSATLATCSRIQQGLATTAQLRSAGVGRSVLSRALGRGVVVRVRPAVYALTPLEQWPTFVVTHEGVATPFVQHVRAVLLSLGEGAAACGTAAACLRGWGLLHEPCRTVRVAVHRGRSRVRLAGVRASQRHRVATEELEVRAGEAPLRVTTAVQTAVDCCHELPLLEAVVACDSALRSREVTVAQLRAAGLAQRSRRAAARVRRVVELCDPESGSVLESVLRVQMVQAGLTDFATQEVVRDRHGRRILRVDFCFALRRLVIETDGVRWHDAPSRDQGLDNRLVAAGWRVLRFTWAQVVHDPQAVLGLVRAALDCGSLDFCADASTSGLAA